MIGSGGGVILYGLGGRLPIGLHGWILIGVVLLIWHLRPTGGGQLLAIFRSADGDGETNVSTGVLLVEILALCCFLTGLAGTVFFGELIADCSGYVGGCFGSDTVADSIADVMGYQNPELLTGSAAVIVMLSGLFFSGVAWIAEGFSFTRNRPWRRDE